MPAKPRFFPSPEEADREGFLILDNNLNQARLLDAYQHGIFPWPYHDERGETSETPGWQVAWYSPEPRAVLKICELHIPRRLKRKLRLGKFLFSVDQRFAEVLECCATVGPRSSNTWLMPELAMNLHQLHQQGRAHSIEVYERADPQRMVGGLYGIPIGQVFCAESMFHLVSDASKAAICALVAILDRQAYSVIDVQVPSELLTRLGAREIPRRDFLKILQSSRPNDGQINWQHPGQFSYSDIIACPPLEEQK